MAAIYGRRKYGKGNLFRKKRYKSSSKKRTTKRLKIKIKIITFDLVSSPSFIEARIKLIEDYAQNLHDTGINHDIFVIGKDGGNICSFKEHSIELDKIYAQYKPVYIGLDDLRELEE